jgi:diguanylate cyclase (GGDEF)-like protein
MDEEEATMWWKPLPDLLSIGLLIYAFLSVSRPEARSAQMRLWLLGWIMIEVHFAASMFVGATGWLGFVSFRVAESALAWTALIFSRSMDTQPQGPESRSWFWALLVVNTLFLFITDVPEIPRGLQFGAIALYAIVPIVLLRRSRLLGASIDARRFEVLTYCATALMIYLGKIGLLGALSDVIGYFAVLTSVYLNCFLRFFATHKRKSGGFVITAVGFLTWSLIFVVGALLYQFLPDLQVDAEVWNLPKFLVAVGMILLLLEDQVARNHDLAQHDALTNLPNRRQFLNRINESIERARRAGTRLALLSVDLDGFKQVNDNLGHQSGDVVLQRVAAMFSARVRRGDLLARVGGDEFFLVLEGNLVLERAQQVAHNLREILDEPLQLGANTIKLGASVGVAIFPDDAQSFESLCAVADERMYAAKARQGAADLDAPDGAGLGTPSRRTA